MSSPERHEEKPQPEKSANTAASQADPRASFEAAARRIRELASRIPKELFPDEGGRENLPAREGEPYRPGSRLRQIHADKHALAEPQVLHFPGYTCVRCAKRPGEKGGKRLCLNCACNRYRAPD